MLIPIKQIVKDFLAITGESPHLSPTLEEGEDSAVLTLEEMLRARLDDCAVKATLETEPVFLDEIEEIYPEIEWSDDGVGKIRLPSDYLKLMSLRMPDWAESVTETEPKGTLRDALRGNAPRWMACPCRPLVVEGRDRKSRFLRIYGSERCYDEPDELLYIVRPTVEGDALRVSSAAYPRMLELLREYAATVS